MSYAETLNKESSGVTKRLRVVVTEWDESHIRVYEASDQAKTPLTIAYDDALWKLSQQLYADAQLNLLTVTIDTDGTLRPDFLILEPDYLVDITAVCRCFMQCGHAATWHVINKFSSSATTLPIQLGNVANQMLDDLTNGNADFLTSMQRSFATDALHYCTLEGVDAKFFDQCRKQHANLQQTVRQLFPEAGIDVTKDEILLEPAFLSEALGLQGRLDLLTGDLHNIVELKSGKADEWNKTYCLHHALQMALYKEVLHYNLGQEREAVKTLLLYSRYPALFDIRLGQAQVAEALAVRNGIVHIERLLRGDGCQEYLLSLQESDFNTVGLDNKFYHTWIRPGITRFLTTLHEADPLTLRYVCRMASFMQREQFLAKMGDGRPYNEHGFAQTWLGDLEEKRQAGDIITDLRLQPITDPRGMTTHLRAMLPVGDAGVMQGEANFREGDTVTLYERNTADDTIVNHQTLRCQIEEIHNDHLLLRLAFPQRNMRFLQLGSRYAIEPAHMDAGFSTAYRGLFSLLTCEPRRRDLILAQRQPEFDERVTLCHHIENPATRHIVLQAMQARDYYLLVGPPGTGKTSVALSHMVQELLASLPGENILLMAYTNRAVDEICEMLEHLPAVPDYVRLGKELSCEPRFRPRLMEHVTARCTNRQQISVRLQPVRVFCGTVTTLCGTPELFLLKRFHTAILDEASQVLEPQLMPLLTAASAIGRFILIGDHKQLPAVVVQPDGQSRVTDEALLAIGLTDCRCSLFERLHRNLTHFRLPRLCGLLDRQGRMHAEISGFVNTLYYNSRLAEVPLPHQQGSLPWTLPVEATLADRLVATHRLLAIDVAPLPDEENHKANRAEAREVGRLVEALHRLHVASGRAWNAATSVGIIVPFRSQIAMIRQELENRQIPHYRDITIDTVERYQGSQRNAIVFSTVVRQRFQLDVLSAPARLDDGMLIDRKLNVAITRAREQFFLVGHLPLLRQAEDYRQLMEYIMNN